MGMEPYKTSSKHIYMNIKDAVLSVIRIFGPCHRTVVMQEIRSLRHMGQVSPYGLVNVRDAIEELHQCKLIKQPLPDVWEDANGNIGREVLLTGEN